MASNALTPLAVCTLGLAAERPMHPYEMYQLILERREDRLVKVKPGTLYHTVARLAAGGLLEPIGTNRDGNRPERTTYRITSTGQQDLDRHLRSILAEPATEYPQFALAVSEAHNLPRNEVRSLLSQRRSALVDRRNDYQLSADQAETEPTKWQYHLDTHYTIAILNAEIAWIDELLVKLADPDRTWVCQ